MSMKRFSHLLAVLFVLVVAVPLPAHAEIHLDLTRGKVEPMAVAIPDFYAEEGQVAQLGRDLAGVITADLRRSGLFEPISPKIFIQTPKQLNTKGPDFSAWRSINSPAVVSGTVSRAKDGRTRVEFRLWDVYAQKQLQGMAYMTTPQNWRRIAHIISDEIYKRLTGESGYFDSRIVFISESGPATSRIKKLAIMDQDGANYRELTDGSNLVLTPRFSPTGPEITYLAYHNNRPRVYLYNIDTGRREVLGDFPGMTFAPRFSPDGNKVIMSLAMNGNSDIYTMDLRTREVKQLTNHLAIDTSPTYSPDGKEVAFESDRGGTQQLYVMDAKGGNVRRITFGDGRYANPVWSPRGDLIAFTKMVGGNFYIGVIRPDGSGERLITQAYHVEGPTWSPNGRVLAYFKELPVGPGGTRRRARLYSIDLTGFNEQEMPTPQDASDPAWSPLNP